MLSCPPSIWLHTHHFPRHTFGPSQNNRGDAFHHLLALTYSRDIASSSDVGTTLESETDRPETPRAAAATTYPQSNPFPALAGALAAVSALTHHDGLRRRQIPVMSIADSTTNHGSPIASSHLINIRKYKHISEPSLWSGRNSGAHPSWPVRGRHYPEEDIARLN